MVRPPLFLLLAGLAAAVPIGARAQVDPFKSSRNAGLRPSDFTAMHNAARKLAEEGNPANGASQPWSNQETGASGSVTIVSTFHHKGMLCHKVAYSAKKDPEAEAQAMTVNWCHTAQGWKML